MNANDDDGIHPRARGAAQRNVWLLGLVVVLCLVLEAVGVAVGLWTPAG